MTTARVGVLLIHGMGNPEASFAEGIIRRLSEELGTAAQEVKFEPCYWSPILQRQQDVTWERLVASSRMDKKFARQWIVSAFGDPVSYLSGYFASDTPAYDVIHECVRASLERLEQRLGFGGSPLVVLAHSLGGVVISNYIWNEQRAANSVQVSGPEKTPVGSAASGKLRACGRTAFERMETLTTLVTYGCNIPLFLPPSPPIECIVFPPPTLQEPLRKVARWLNVYDPDDLLGYPIARIWDDDKGTRIEDIVLDVGPWLLSETPLSHVYYERDRDFRRLVARELKIVLTA